MTVAEWGKTLVNEASWIRNPVVATIPLFFEAYVGLAAMLATKRWSHQR